MRDSNDRLTVDFLEPKRRGRPPVAHPLDAAARKRAQRLRDREAACSEDCSGASSAALCDALSVAMANGYRLSAETILAELTKRVAQAPSDFAQMMAPA